MSGRTFVALAFVASILAACTAIVPTDLPSFSCAPNTEGACGAGEYCSATGACVACGAQELACDGVDEDCDGVVDDLAPCPDGATCIAGRCVVPSDAGVAPSDGSVGVDVYTCSTANCPAPSMCDPAANRCIAKGSVADGARCIGDAVCATGICASQGMVPAGWIEAGRFCTKTCCSSSECSADSVCAAAGTGARYCVKATTIGIVGLGAKLVGESCSGPEVCRSGRCESGVCADVCCGDANCGAGRRCTVAAVQTGGAAVTGMHCRPTSSTATVVARGACSDNTDCASGMCRQVSTNFLEPSLCMAGCCSSSACGSARTLLSTFVFRCSYERPSGVSAVVATCREGANKDGKRIGEPCTVDGDCYSNQCDSRIGKCTDVCCTHDDCSRDAPGWRCVPLSTSSPYAPRCQPPN